MGYSEEITKIEEQQKRYNPNKRIEIFKNSRNKKFIKNIFLDTKDSIYDISLNYAKNEILFNNLEIFKYIGYENLETNIRFIRSNFTNTSILNHIPVKYSKYFNIEYILKTNPELSLDPFLRGYLIENNYIKPHSKKNDDSIRYNFKILKQTIENHDENFKSVYKNFVKILHKDFLPLSQKESEIFINVLNNYEVFLFVIKNTLFQYSIGQDIALVNQIFKTKSNTLTITWLKDFLLKSSNIRERIFTLSNYRNLVKNELSTTDIEFNFLMYKNINTFLNSKYKTEYFNILKLQNIPKYFYNNEILKKSVNLIIPEEKEILINNPKNNLLIKFSPFNKKIEKISLFNNNFSILNNEISILHKLDKIIIINYEAVFDVKNDKQLVIESINGSILTKEEKIYICEGAIDVMVEVKKNNVLYIYWKGSK